MLCGKSPSWGRRKSRGMLPSAQGEKPRVEVGERQEPSHPAMRRGPEPRRDRRVRNDANVTCALLPHSKIKQSSCVQWPLRKTSHFLRSYQTSPCIVSVSSDGRHYLTSTRAVSLLRQEKLPEWCFLLSTGQVAHLQCMGSVFWPRGLARRQN